MVQQRRKRRWLPLRLVSYDLSSLPSPGVLVSTRRTRSELGMPGCPYTSFPLRAHKKCQRASNLSSVLRQLQSGLRPKQILRRFHRQSRRQTRCRLLAWLQLAPLPTTLRLRRDRRAAPKTPRLRAGFRRCKKSTVHCFRRLRKCRVAIIGNRTNYSVTKPNFGSEQVVGNGVIIPVARYLIESGHCG